MYATIDHIWILTTLPKRENYLLYRELINARPRMIWETVVCIQTSSIAWFVIMHNISESQTLGKSSREILIIIPHCQSICLVSCTSLTLQTSWIVMCTVNKWARKVAPMSHRCSCITFATMKCYSSKSRLRSCSLIWAPVQGRTRTTMYFILMIMLLIHSASNMWSLSSTYAVPQRMHVTIFLIK
jgi:hypothetical protein